MKSCNVEGCDEPRHVGPSGRVYGTCPTHYAAWNARRRTANADRRVVTVAEARGYRRRPIGLDVYRACQRCLAVVGPESLAVCLWPPHPHNGAGAERSRWSQGRARLCEACCVSTGAKVRVHARTFTVAPSRRSNLVDRNPGVGWDHRALFAKRA